MNKNKITKIILILIVLFMTIGNSVSYATGITYGDYKPQAVTGGSATQMFDKLLNILIVVGIIAVTIAIALIGFNTILGSASEKADYQQKLVGVVFAALMISGGSVIAKFIISFAKNLV